MNKEQMMQPLEWFVAIWEGIFYHLHRFLQFHWSVMLVISTLVVFAVVFEQRWSLLETVADVMGAILAKFYQISKESGLPIFWWPLLAIWLLLMVPFFVMVLLIALICYGGAAVTRLATGRRGIPPNVA